MALLVRAPGTEKKSALGLRAYLLFNVREADAVPRHQKFNRYPNEQKGRYINRENLKCLHGRFPAI